MKSSYAVINRELAKYPAKYRFSEDGMSTWLDCGSNHKPHIIFWQDHGSNKSYRLSDEYFNHGSRRGNTTLITGDRPCFALARGESAACMDPRIFKAGDCSVRFETSGVMRKLDEANDIHTVFHFGYTEYTISFSGLPELTIRLTISHALDCGCAATLVFINSGRAPIDITASFDYGRLDYIDRPVTAAYFDRTKPVTRRQDIAINGAFVRIAAEDAPFGAGVRGCPEAEAREQNGRVIFSRKLTVNTGEIAEFSLLAWILEDGDEQSGPLEGCQPAALLEDSRQYYDAILGQYSVNTPDKLIDAGFAAGVVNLDYDFAGRAWLEGIHYWAAPWCNNYQISAAISLGQIDRAGAALQFFARPIEGPCAIFMSNLEPLEDDRYGFTDGLPYYLYALTRYDRHTGDELLLSLWDKVRRSVDRMLTEKAGPAVPCSAGN